jgi:uroporphyrinogen-III synthase
VIAPLFAVRTIDWAAPAASRFDALMLTSGHAAARAGPSLSSYDQLPCYCVGDATASSARRTGLTRIVTGPSDGSALLDMMAADGVRSALHLCGRDHVEQGHPEIRIERRVVYGSEAVSELPREAVHAIRAGAMPLIHSPRSGRIFAELAASAGLDRSTISVLALSGAAAAALGSGWRGVASATTPTDQALLELAAKLCQNADESGPGQ